MKIAMSLHTRKSCEEETLQRRSKLEKRVDELPNNSHGNVNNSYSIANTALTTLINIFAGSSVVAGSGKGATAAVLNNSTATTSGLASWLNNVPTPPNGSSIPKAYINWILFDEQFKPVSSGSDAALLFSWPIL